jgi:hypothetical protein
MESCDSIQGKSNEPKNAIKTQTWLLLTVSSCSGEEKGNAH